MVQVKNALISKYYKHFSTKIKLRIFLLNTKIEHCPF